ncbi:hypothetical protein GCM10012285_67880 [Streptomyces kronopolitis]|uniref:Uncharacterized protein n=1 Tax=Streptomyces kronopolitis TaxID=1612435 RepID=A0ABQ2K442_9ACTN|nr:hypothetical protein GCM10012285_67880 [Streptomyces kronopolitis]
MVNGAGGGADHAAEEATGHVVQVAVGDFLGLNLGGGVHDVSLRMNNSKKSCVRTVRWGGPGAAAVVGFPKSGTDGVTPAVRRIKARGPVAQLIGGPQIRTLTLR